MNPATGCAPCTLPCPWGEFTRNRTSLDRRRGCRSAANDAKRDHPTSSFNSFGQTRVLSCPTRGGDSRVVPLLDPLSVGGCSVGVPFVAGIELHEDTCRAPPPRFEGGGDGEVYELRFVLRGRGVLRYSDGWSGGGSDDCGRETMVETGDAILMRHGVARLDGLRAPDDDPCSMATFVTYMPGELLERGTGHAPTRVDFSWFGARHLWGDACDAESSRKLSDVMDKQVFDGLLSGATLWMERSVDDIQGSLDPFESIDDVEPSLATPDSAIDHDIEINRVYHTQIASSTTYELPNQTNRLALLFDPFADTPVPFVFGVEIFEPGHQTRPHIHEIAYEVFFILSGEGEGFCDGERFALTAGDIVAFHPGSEHGIDNGTGSKMYCIEVMMPDEEFAQFVRAGRLDGLGKEELCILRRVGCQ